MTDHWLANLFQHDMLTLSLAAVSLAAVLIGWGMIASHKNKFDEFMQRTYLGFILLAWLVILAGSALFLIFGGRS
jgi:hypothetical protein